MFLGYLVFFLWVCLCVLSFILPRVLYLCSHPTESRRHNSSWALVLFYFSYRRPFSPQVLSFFFFIGSARAKSLPPSFLRSLWVYLQLLFAKLGLCLWASLLVLFVPARFYYE